MENEMRFKMEIIVNVDVMNYVAKTGSLPKYLNNSVCGTLERYIVEQVFPKLKKAAMDEVSYSVNMVGE